MRLITIPENELETSYTAKLHASLSTAVTSLHAAFESTHSLKHYWNISSTETGGGVAEILPTFVRETRALGGKIDWAVAEPPSAMSEGFFRLTKRMHNAIHGAGTPFSSAESADAVALYDAVSKAQASDLLSLIGCVDPERDVVVLHDPQVLGMSAHLKRSSPSLKIIWRCHIGIEGADTPVASSAWALLEPYLQSSIDVIVVSACEYVRAAFAHKTRIIHPGLAPLSEKNKELSPYDITQTLLRSGLMPDFLVGKPGCELVEEPFVGEATILRPRRMPVGRAWPVGRSSTTSTTSSSAAVGGPKEPEADPLFPTCETPWDSIPFLTRPVVSQISRFDTLKGFLPLLDAWVLLKKNVHHFVEAPYHDQLALLPIDRAHHDAREHASILRAAVLCLAGPDPSGVSDDPEAPHVLEELTRAYDALPETIQRSVRIVVLPMGDKASNALMVNAIQRASTVVVQNSLREGFGLCVAEALYKRTCCIGTSQAVGIRSQIRDGIDGLLTQGNPSDSINVATTLNIALGYPTLRERLATNGQKRVVDTFLVYNSLIAWNALFEDLDKGVFRVDPRDAPPAAHAPSGAEETAPLSAATAPLTAAAPTLAPGATSGP